MEWVTVKRQMLSFQVWANVQRNDKPSQMSFQFTNAAEWKPLFHKGFPNPGLASIQVSILRPINQCIHSRSCHSGGEKIVFLFNF